VAPKHIVLASTIHFINEMNGGGGQNRTAVLKQRNKSRYMLSLSFKLTLTPVLSVSGAFRIPVNSD